MWQTSGDASWPSSSPWTTYPRLTRNPDSVEGQLLSRENFVIAVDYETGDIKWILGDTTKQWAEFPSLTSLALNLGANTLPPIGQHAVSITRDDRLMV